MGLKKEMGIATIANWCGAFFSYIIAFFATPIIVHSFGETRYGIWSLAVTLTAYYGMLDFGINLTIQKYFSEYFETKENELANSVFNSALLLYVSIFGVLLVILSILLLGLDRIFNIPPEYIGESRVLFLIIGIAFGIELIGNAFRAIVLSLRKFVLKNSIQTVFSIIRTLGIIVVLKNGYGIIEAGLYLLLVDLSRNIFYVIWVLRNNPFLKISFKNIELKFFKEKFIGFTIFNFMRMVSMRILERVDLILVGMFFDMHIVAFYSIGESLCRYAQLVPKGLRATILPFSSKLNAQNKTEEIKKMAIIFPKYTVSFVLGIILMMSVFGQLFMNLWMGEGYDLSVHIFLILLSSQAIFMSQSIVIHILIGMGYNKFFGYLGIFEVCCKIIFCIIFSKISGVYGIALGSLFTFVISSLIIVPNYALKKLNVGKLKFYTDVVLKQFLLILLLYYINRRLGDNLLYIPVVLIEYIFCFYIFVWKEIKFNKNKLKFEVII